MYTLFPCTCHQKLSPWHNFSEMMLLNWGALHYLSFWIIWCLIDAFLKTLLHIYTSAHSSKHCWLFTHTYLNGMKDTECAACWLDYCTQEHDLCKSRCHTNKKLCSQPHNFMMLFVNVWWIYGFGKQQTVKLSW